MAELWSADYAMDCTVKKTSPSVQEIFASMEYGPAPESDKVAQDWLEQHDRNFGLFINNEWVRPEGRKTYEVRFVDYSFL